MRNNILRPNCIFIVVLLCIGLTSCEESYDPSQVFTIEEFYDYCGSSEIDCGETVVPDGDIIKVRGFIRGSGISRQFNSLFLYGDGDPNDAFVNIVGDSLSVFEVLEEIVGETRSDLFEVTISAKIRTVDLPTNGACKAGVVLDLDDADDIFQD